jgi:hypothetical protein
MYLYKTVATASAVNRTYAAIESRGIHFQCTAAERLQVLGAMFKIAGHNSFGYDALAIVLIRAGLRKLGTTASRVASGGTKRG